MQERFYDERMQAAIAMEFKRLNIDQQPSQLTHLLVTGEFQQKFGSVNFKGLDEVLRGNRFSSRFLAVSKRNLRAAPALHQTTIIIPDDVPSIYQAAPEEFDAIVLQKRPALYTAFLYPNEDYLQKAALEWGIRYDFSMNQENLYYAGIMVARPGSNVSRQLKGLQGMN